MAEERSSSYICAEDISVGYHNLPLIQKINLHVNRGEILTLIGPNGAGKSTILKSLIGQLKLVKGAVWLDGTSMGTMKEKEIALRMSVMMTGRVKTERMTCEEVVSMGRYPYTGKMGILTEKDWQIVRESLELVQGLELAEKDFEAVSDGQRQRVLLARAICQEPQVIVLDEPTAFLDIRHKLELLYLLKNMVREKKVAVLMSLHELDLAQKISDHIICVKGDIFHWPLWYAGGNFQWRLYQRTVSDRKRHLSYRLWQRRVGSCKRRAEGVCHWRKWNRDPGVSAAAKRGNSLCSRYPVGKRQGISGGRGTGFCGDSGKSL